MRLIAAGTRQIQLFYALVFWFAVASSGAQSVAITEFIKEPAPSTNEWVELYNYGTTTATLSNYVLRDDDSDSISIPEGTTIGPRHFLVLVRNKDSFVRTWLKGQDSPNVIPYGSGVLFMSDTGADEIRLQTQSGTVLWRLAYGASSTPNTAMFFASDSFSVSNHGTKSNVINIAGNDPLTGLLGYESDQLTVDPMADYAFTGSDDFGSPLKGHYSGAVNPPQPTSWIVDVSAPGRPVNPGVRGLAIADQALDRHDNSDITGILPTLDVSRGSAIRGVAGGLYADMYDWKRRNDMPRPTTLQFLRWARDYDAELYVTVNTRGLTSPDPMQPSHRIYHTSDTALLAQLAADWVRYTNHIVPTYKQGDAITDPRDAAIMNELVWNTGYVNEFGSADNYTTLTATGEPPVAPVTYWEIGNEPTISLNNAYSVTNGFTFTSMPEEYRDRYLAITQAMLLEDPSIKVGPCLVNGRSGSNALMLSTLLQSAARIDFISYHPYGSMGDHPSSPTRQQRYLGGVYGEQEVFLREIKDLVAQYRPGQANTMEYVASETNVSDFRTNNQFQEGCMAHALGCVETVMSYARLGLTAAHYWIWITATPTYLADTNRFAATMAWEKMRDTMGDELVGAFDSNDLVHAYVFRESPTGKLTVWLLNFSHTADQAFHLSLADGPTAPSAIVKQTQLKAISGVTNLFSANLNPEINFGVPRRDVDWTPEHVLPSANPQDLNLVLPAATITLVTIEDVSHVNNWGLY